MRIFRIKEVVVDPAHPWQFPLRAARDKVTRVVVKPDADRVGVEYAGDAGVTGSAQALETAPRLESGGVAGTKVVVDARDDAPLRADGQSGAGASSSSSPPGPQEGAVRVEGGGKCGRNRCPSGRRT